MELLFWYVKHTKKNMLNFAYVCMRIFMYVWEGEDAYRG